MELALVGYRMRVTVQRESEAPKVILCARERELARQELWAEVDRQREAMRTRFGQASFFRVG